MTQTKTQPIITTDLLTKEPTTMPIFPSIDPLGPPTSPTFTELLEKYTASIDEPKVAWNHLTSDASVDPNALSQNNTANAKPQDVHYLWEKRLPRAGLTLLDGDHGCGKSLLAIQIAASVSSGTPMPDGTETLQGGVVIISPTISATTQLQLLTALGANLERIEILSFIQEPASESHTQGSHPFSLPEDLPKLFDAIQRVNARLVIFDPFITLLSRQRRCTNDSLCHLLIDLNQHLIEHNIACLLIRNCGAKGSHARPTVLERSDHFEICTISRLLLSPDPMQPNHILLSHAKSRHTALTPTLILQIQSLPHNPDIPHIKFHGTHTLKAKELIESRPDTLHRQLLSQHLLHIITNVTDPIHVSILYANSHNSSPFQVQRSLNDLLRTGQIERPARGFYAPTPDNPVFTLKETAATTSSPKPASELKETAAITSNPKPASELKETAATTSSSKPASELKTTAATTSSSKTASELKETAATTSNPKPASKLKTTAAITSNPKPANELKETAATISNPKSAGRLNTVAATTHKGIGRKLTGKRQSNKATANRLAVAAELASASVNARRR